MHVRLVQHEVVDFKKQLDISFSQFKAGWQDRKQAQWNQIYCVDNPSFAQAVASGWTISTTTTDVDGKRHYMQAKCAAH